MSIVLYRMINDTYCHNCCFTRQYLKSLCRSDHIIGIRVLWNGRNWKPIVQEIEIRPTILESRQECFDTCVRTLRNHSQICGGMHNFLVLFFMKGSEGLWGPSWGRLGTPLGPLRRSWRSSRGPLGAPRGPQEDTESAYVEQSWRS